MPKDASALAKKQSTESFEGLQKQKIGQCTFKPRVNHSRGKRSADAFFRDMLDYRDRSLKWRENERERNELA